MSGGVQQILAMLWTALIQDVRTLQPYLNFVENASGDEMESFHNIFGQEVSPEKLILDFLSGSGVPDENKWAEIINEGQLQSIPSRDEMAKPSFRPKMLTWAMTGSSHLPAAGNSMQVGDS